MDIVAVDIGGTHARFALARITPAEITLGEVATFETASHASFESAWEHFAAVHGGALPAAAAIAIAGPVAGELIRLTNNPWLIRPASFGERLGVRRHVLVNDFEAVAHAVARCGPDHFLHVCGTQQALPPNGTISVLGPGTGLGVAQLWRAADGAYRVQATEGGHVDFAPLDTIEDAFVARLRQRHRRVSIERIVSGPAIVDIYESLAALEQRAIGAVDDRTLWQRGLSGDDTLAAAAVDRFCLTLGAVAGDVALTHGAGGVVIAGGLGFRLKDTLPRSGFAERFRAKGRFEGMMATLPVKLITHPQPGLLGAAAAFALANA